MLMVIKTWRKTVLRIAFLTTGLLFQAQGCTTNDGNELIAAWLASITGTFITDYVNGIFNNSSGGF